MSSSDFAIRVEDVRKEYRLGSIEPYRALRDVLTQLGTAPFRAAAGLARRGESRQQQRRPLLAALDGVSFDVHRGEVVSLVGANGAGKSTMLKVLSRITEPTAGQVTLRGRVGSLLEVGTGFHPELTGRENVYLNGSILGMRRSEITRRFDEIVDFSGVERFLDTPVKRYSSGMQVRLAFAVAAHLQPEILLVDEVLAVGDAEFQKKCLGKMEDVTREGRTVIFVSHNMAAVRSLCPRSILLDQGRVVMDGPTADVLHHYLGGSGTSGRAWVEREQLERLQASTKLYAPEPVITCHAVGVIDEAGYARTTFRSDEEITIIVDYECLRPLQRAVIQVECFDEAGAKVLLADSNDDPETLSDLEPGRYRATCVLPRNLFGDVRLSLNVSLVAPLLQNLFYPQIVDVEIQFQGFNGNATSSGALRPVLNWSVENATRDAVPGQA